MKQVKITTTYAKPPAKSQPLVSVATATSTVDNVYARNLRENDFRLESVKTTTRTKTACYAHVTGRVATIVTDVVKGVEVSLALSMPGEKKALMNDDALMALTPPSVEEPAKKVDAMLHDAARTAPIEPKEHRDPPAAPIVSDEPPIAPTNPLKTSPLHQVLKKAQFKFVKAEVVANVTVYGYQHRDHRAVLLTTTAAGVEVWTLRWPDGAESGGKKADVLAGCLKVNANRHVAAMGRAAAQDEREAGKTDEARTVLAAVKPGQLLPSGPADHVLRAVEMLGHLTAKRYDFTLLRGDRYYGDRMALLRVLLARDRGEVKAAETGINTVQTAFYSALGVKPGSAAVRAAAFTERCVELIDAWHKAQKLVQKAGARMTAKKRRDTTFDRAVPGRIIPYSKQRSKTAEKEEREKEVATVASELRSSLPEAKPNPDASLIGPVDVRAIRSVSYNNGAFGLRLECGNSQGALCLVGNGKRLTVSVLTPVLLKLATVSRVDLDSVDGLLATLEHDNLERSPRAEEIMKAVKKALKTAREPGHLAPAVLPAATPRDSADKIVLRPADVKLLEDPELGVVLLQLEAPNSQGAICVYNNGRRVAAVVVPPDVLKVLRPIRGVDVVKAASQLMTPINPGVPVSPVAQSYLTAVIHCKELIPMATASVAIAKKFEAPKGVAKKSTTKKSSAGRTSSLTDEQLITVVAKENPYAKGSKAFNTFALFAKAKTVGAFRKLAADKSEFEAGYLRYASRDGHIKVR